MVSVTVVAGIALNAFFTFPYKVKLHLNAIIGVAKCLFKPCSYPSSSHWFIGIHSSFDSNFWLGGCYHLPSDLLFWLSWATPFVLYLLNSSCDRSRCWIFELLVTKQQSLIRDYKVSLFFACNPSENNYLSCRISTEAWFCIFPISDLSHQSILNQGCPAFAQFSLAKQLADALTLRVQSMSIYISANISICISN